MAANRVPVFPRCRECSVRMISRQRKTTPGRRHHLGRGLCTGCYAAARKAGALSAYAFIASWKAQP